MKESANQENKRTKQIKVLLLAPYPPAVAPNQRFRFEQYLDYLQSNNIHIDYTPFWSVSAWKIIYEPGHMLRKMLALMGGTINRFALLGKLKRYDFIWVHREVLPIGPPVLEFIMARWLGKKIIYDFDDAIWVENSSKANRWIVRFFKFHSKVRKICRYSHLVSGGNHFLADYARKFQKRVVVIPTTIDTQHYHNQTKEVREIEAPVIGWTGTHSTLIQLRQVEKALAQLQKHCNAVVHVICNEDPLLKDVNYRYIPWKKETEIEDLLAFDIGIMPLRNSDWERGKCGFKALQYMSLGIPVVASAVGANKDIITHEKNGMLLPDNQPETWVPALIRLITDNQLREHLGTAGRQRVIDEYAVESNKERYLRLFKDER